MRNTWKIAKWELKRNLKNKSFIIGLFITPIIFLAFFFIPSFFENTDSKNTTATTVFINDGLNILTKVEKLVDDHNLSWELKKTNLSETEIQAKMKDSEDTAYIFLNEKSLTEGTIPIYTSKDIDSQFYNDIYLLETPLRTLQYDALQLSEQDRTILSNPFTFTTMTNDTETENSSNEDKVSIKQIVPGAFGIIIFLSITLTGMMIFQSASQEKKDKIAEIILSSVTPSELMQGKIIGYFILGMIQCIVYIAFLLPLAIWKIDLPIIEYLLVPELAIYILIAILGYLLFASLFVGIGATMADMSTSGNLQGFILMLPFSPVIFIGPVLNDPSGMMAQIGSYIPFTSPGILLLRLTMLKEWPWIEIIISLVVLVISVWLMMKLAGKIFKIGILLYGKNATPREIWKWIRA